LDVNTSTGALDVVHETETRVRTRSTGLEDLLAAAVCELPAPRVSLPTRVRVSPLRAEEISHGPARANPGVDHGTSAPSFVPGGRLFQHEYRPLEIELVASDLDVVSAEVHGDPAPSRPHHATLFWKNVGEGFGKMILEVDWRPDFERRIRSSVKPSPTKRTREIDLIVVHQTGGTNMGSQLNTFLNKKKGAHYVIDVDGHVVRVADDRYHTVHGAGGKNRTPSWAGRELINHRAVGIENCHADASHLDIDKNPFQEAQYSALIDLIQSLREAYGPSPGTALSPRHVVGHHDVAIQHQRCPGPHLDWPRLAAAGQALAPETLTEAEIDAMFGRFFAGADGSSRRIEIGDEQRGGPTEFRLRQSSGVEVGGLTAGPITELRQALVDIGYAPRRSFGSMSRSKTTFEGVTVYCVMEFMRHFCTGSRIRKDQPIAYRDLGTKGRRDPTGVFIDLALATLIKGVEKAALANP